MEPAFLPHNLARAVSGYSPDRIIGGCSQAEVFLLRKWGHANLYLKTAPRNRQSALRQERDRLEWLNGRLPVPQMHFFGHDTRREYLLMSEVPGTVASDKSHTDLPRLVHLLAEGLRLIHGVSIDDCPFDQTLSTQLEAAHKNLINGSVDESDFDPHRRGRKAADLFHELLQMKPQHEDVVFTHGDYCLPNVLITKSELDGDSLSGFIDWGSGGIGDRYRDLALAARSLSFNFDTQWVPLLFEEYGLQQPDQAKLDFYMLLDEFF